MVAALSFQASDGTVDRSENHQENLQIQIDNERGEKETTRIYLGLSAGERQDLMNSNPYKSAPYSGREILHALS